MGDLIDVIIKVPLERIPEFYRDHGRWLESPPEVGSVGTLLDWEPDDLDRATELWELLSQHARALIEFLLDHPGMARAQEVVQALGLANEFVLAGTLSWPRRHAATLGRRLPISAEETPDGTYYWLDDVTKELLREAKGRTS
ncbi:MAG: DUF6416 domain-containing protein [Actinomycetota bacterium]